MASAVQKNPSQFLKFSFEKLCTYSKEEEREGKGRQTQDGISNEIAR